MDVLAFAGTGQALCAAILRYRQGRLTDKREFVFHDTSDMEELREEFLPRYYLDGEEVPRVIAVDQLPESAKALNQALDEARGSHVKLYVPQRGDVAALVRDGLHQRGRAAGPGERPLCPGGKAAGRAGPDSWAFPARPGSSRATTSPTGETAPRCAAWWCLRTASPKRAATGGSR